ncbi:MAG: formylmethanofuran dehydrogenase subunit C [Pirellulales bacterium]
MLRLSYFAETTIPVEVEGLIPSLVRGQSLAEIEKFPLYHGNRQLPLAEFFRVEGDPSDERIEFEGNLAGVHWIGAKMDGGEICVRGPAGRHIGSEMTKGRIDVLGDASDWVGGELQGGLIHVRGRAGHLIGAAYRGSRRGMAGGTILVGGDVGNEVGHTMRRGLLVVGGQCGDAPAFNMIAGTVAILGGCGIRPAAGMRRGTLLLAGENPPPLLPTFRAACRLRPSFVPLLSAELRRHEFAFDSGLLDSDFTLHHGDMIESGRGEVLIRAT